MKIGVFGTGMVGQTIAAALAAKGHEVMIGTRDVQKSLAHTENNPFGMPGFGVWITRNPQIRVGTFAEAAAFGELLVNATNGMGSLPALEAAGAEKLGSKVLIDISNPLDFSKGMPPTLFVKDTDSLAEQIQRAFPNLKVVKTLNTVNALVMVNPKLVAGDSTIFLSGDDETAKATVRGILESFGWADIFDLGDLSSARAVEMLLPLWLRAWQKIGNTPFNIKVVR